MSHPSSFRVFEDVEAEQDFAVVVLKAQTVVARRARRVVSALLSV